MSHRYLAWGGQCRLPASSASLRGWHRLHWRNCRIVPADVAQQTPGRLAGYDEPPVPFLAVTAASVLAPSPPPAASSAAVDFGDAAAAADADADADDAMAATADAAMRCCYQPAEAPVAPGWVPTYSLRMLYQKQHAVLAAASQCFPVALFQPLPDSLDGFLIEFPVDSNHLGDAVQALESRLGSDPSSGA